MNDLIALQVYCGEIAEKSIRGTLGSFYQLMITAGILFAYILGWLLSAKTTSLVCGVIPIVSGVCIFFCPESPTYLVSKNFISHTIEIFSNFLITLRL